jgi:hypothetical protein
MAGSQPNYTFSGTSLTQQHRQAQTGHSQRQLSPQHDEQRESKGYREINRAWAKINREIYQVVNDPHL